MDELQINLEDVYREGVKLFEAGRYSDAAVYLEKAAVQGHAGAQFCLALCFDAKGAAHDLPEAVYWYQRAAEQGHVGAQYNLAVSYSNGQGVAQDNEKASHWFQLAAEAGDPGAQFNLANLYYCGEGVIQDLEKALYWYQMAAEQGDVDAQFNLALCYYNGEGTDQDIQIAAHWFQKAAEQGDAGAQDWMEKSKTWMSDDLCRYCGGKLRIFGKMCNECKRDGSVIEERKDAADLHKFHFTDDISRIISNCKEIIIPKARADLVAWALGAPDVDSFDVSYEVNGEKVSEASVVRCKNGIVVNYTEDYMRRRDPDCLIVADDNPSDKPKYRDVFKKEFSLLRDETFRWLENQDLIITPFLAGGRCMGIPAVLIAPKNASFFACGLAGLQYFVNIDEYDGDFIPKLVIFVAPPFRHTHFGGKQIVVHNRTSDLYEMFSYNLYPGPSAKKGVYGFLLDIGEREGWLTAHASAVKVITPYENEIVIMHEGASGGGKSEMGENIHRELDGKIVIGQNLETMEKFYLTIEEPCELRPIADDMVLCHPTMQEGKKLVICDAEDGWFLRLDHITEYGTEPFHERIYVHPSEPLVFLNMQGIPGATCLVWEHAIDSNGKPCPNPRVILPRSMVPKVVAEPVQVDVRSFGVRTPPCSAERPSYGILGMLQIIPPAVAWLWRLVAPRGHNNPSIIETQGMTSEGVGSYWPFLTGRIVTHANLLLEQVLKSPSTRYVLIPNQYIGYYQVGFMPQWIMREYLARRGSARFKEEHLTPARCPLLGYCLESLKVDGQYIRRAFLRPETQVEVGLDGYDKGAEMLNEFFKRELPKFLAPDLNPLGREIIECCLNDCTLEGYKSLIPMRF
ncbi:MAG: DUF4914 family protein [Oscillospiraceae bacterium]|nr:DUF4914 family protein [Oscillospiraceae bacterium]